MSSQPDGPAEPRPPASAEPRQPVSAEPRPPGSARRMFASTVLVSELLVVGFATLVAHGLRLADLGLVWAAGGAVMAVCAVAAALLRTRAGYLLGWAVQALLIATGVAVPMMFAVGIIFAILWAASMTIGARIDRERQERYAAEVAHYRSGAAAAG
ncbi:DUF4233 domain-containing protein [Georgenia sp. TF02-10]|uniref:DUF4233 domain-containing protein n=1 Tax=Georgenia sp. TF02-10 TaxID=2917725 RepID=UPI001FA741A9|nr:DUF4233 domain-containing protein [Georgenia sp. TF02-10]UNX55880.1 DUF4233 domain-containing protein [Georgenia sp. TF02-10]